MSTPFSEMPFNDKVSNAAGKLLLAIGEGRFRDCLDSVLYAISQDAYQRGKKEGIAIEKAAARKKKKGRS